MSWAALRQSYPWVDEAALSLLWLAVVLLVRALALRVVHRTAPQAGERVHLRWTVQVRSTAVVLALLGLGFIWATELHDMALGVTALAVAIVIATKEMLLCVMGAVLRASSKSYSVGDRIELAGVRGDVIDHGLFATTLLEIGPAHQWTGRALTVPNSLLLTEPVTNESHLDDYVLHLVRVPVSWDERWRQVEQALLEVAEAECSEHLEPTRRQFAAQAERQGLDMPQVEPRVSLQVPEAGKLELLLRVPVPMRDKGLVEQRLLRRFLDALRERNLGAGSERGDSSPAA